MTLDEAIQYAEDLGTEEENKIDYDKDSPHTIIRRKNMVKDYRQLVEWLTDYKELKNSIGAVKLKEMKEAVRLLQELNAENVQLTSQLTEAKRLLKLAVDDLEELHSEADSSCNCCKGEKAESCQFIKCWTWRYADEALKLIGDERDAT